MLIALCRFFQVIINACSASISRVILEYATLFTSGLLSGPQPRYVSDWSTSSVQHCQLQLGARNKIYLQYILELLEQDLLFGTITGPEEF